MYQLLETIKIKAGQIYNIDLHNERLNKSRLELFGSTARLDLNDYIFAPKTDDKLYKCRVIYAEKIDNVEYQHYEKRNISGFILAESPNINYEYKLQNRLIFSQLKKEYNCPEDFEIIIIKNELITDTSFTNIVFYDGKKWITPKKPLLNGVKRQSLLRGNIICEKNIFADDIFSGKYSRFRLINSLLNFDESNEYQTNTIIKQ